MKRSVKLAALLLALVAALGGYALLRQTDWNETVQEAVSIRLLDVATTDMQRLEWDYAGEHAALEQVEGVWQVLDDPAFPVNQDIVVRMASAMSLVESSRCLGAVSSLEPYGLTQPLCTVTLTTRSGERTAIALGDTNEFTGEYYALLDGCVYLLNADIPSACARSLWSLLRPETLPSLTQATRVGISSPAGALTLEKHAESGLAYSEEYQWFEPSPAGLAPVDLQFVPTLLDMLEGLSFTTVAAYNAGTEELDAWGLSAPRGRVQVDYGADGRLELELGKRWDEGTLVRLAGSTMVYLIDNASADYLLSRPTAERRPDELCRVNIHAIVDLEISLRGQTSGVNVTTRAAAPSDIPTAATTEYVYTSNGKELDSAAMQQALMGVYELSGSGFAGALSGEETWLTLEYHLSNGENVLLRFWERDEETCLAQREGGEVLLCPHAGVEAIVEILESLLA